MSRTVSRGRLARTRARGDARRRGYGRRIYIVQDEDWGRSSTILFLARPDGVSHRGTAQPSDERHTVLERASTGLRSPRSQITAGWRAGSFSATRPLTVAATRAGARSVPGPLRAANARPSLTGGPGSRRGAGRRPIVAALPRLSGRAPAIGCAQHRFRPQSCST